MTNEEILKTVSEIGMLPSNMCKFIAYVDSFYNPKDGIYPIKGMTDTMILDAVKKYTAKCCSSLYDDVTWGGGDSIDRERVRDIILEDNNLVFPS